MLQRNPPFKELYVKALCLASPSMVTISWTDAHIIVPAAPLRIPYFLKIHDDNRKPTHGKHFEASKKALSEVKGCIEI